MSQVKEGSIRGDRGGRCKKITFHKLEKGKKRTGREPLVWLNSTKQGRRVWSAKGHHSMAPEPKVDNVQMAE